MMAETPCDHEWELRGVSFELETGGTHNYECRRCQAVMALEQPTSVPRPGPSAPEAP
jgi:hypothetical protein